MSEIKWIKVAVDLFDDEKIMLIEAMPNADSIIVIWFKLLCFAGKQNNGGIFILNDRIPYTDEMLSAIFRRPLNDVRLALQTFEDLGMIEIVDGAVCIPKWNKHQSMIDKKEYDRLAQQKHREKVKLLSAPDNVNDSVNDKSLNVKDKNKNKEIRNKKKERESIDKDPRHKYGEYNHVLLSDEDYAKLKELFPDDYQAKIQNLDDYLENNPKKHYANHLLTIRTWARKDKPKQEEQKKEFDVTEYGRSQGWWD